MMPKKAVAFKVISGTLRADEKREINTKPKIATKTIESLPKPPNWLPNSHAVREWNRLGQVMVANKMLTESGISAFGMLCALHGKLVQLWSAGETPAGQMMSQYRSLINDFGLTPVSQGRVKYVGQNEDETGHGNKFKKNRGRPPSPYVVPKEASAADE